MPIDFYGGHGRMLIVLACVVIVLVLVVVYGSVRCIPNARVGVVEKFWSLGGSVKSGLLALNGEAGFQPELLRGGFHVFPPFQYRVHIGSMVSVTQGKIGSVFARDGQELQAGGTQIENIMSQLRDRQIAREQVKTFAQKQVAADKRAQKQAELTASLVDVSINDNNGAAAVKSAERRREENSLLPQADRYRLENDGAGKAAAIKAIGEAEAVIGAKGQALEGEGADKQLTQTVMLRLAEAFEAKVPLAPQIQLGGANEGNAFATLMALMSSLKAKELAGG